MLNRRIVIDFLFLDLTVCDRCLGTQSIIDEALNDLSKVIDALKIDVKVNKININSEELAYKYKFITSPTIRINGYDIQMDIKENECEPCGCLCGSKVDCRTWTYDGVVYTTPPKALIIEEILKEIFTYPRQVHVENEYVLPKNLKIFFSSLNKKKKITKKMYLKNIK